MVCGAVIGERREGVRGWGAGSVGKNACYTSART